MQKRPVGRPRIDISLKRKPIKFYLNEREKDIVKEFVKCLKAEKQN